MILCTFEWWLLPLANWPFSFHFAASNLYAECLQIILVCSAPLFCRASHPLPPQPEAQNSRAQYSLKCDIFLWIQSTLVRKAGNEQVEEGGEIEIILIHFSSCQLSFYSGLNFIVKVFHNQNFMLAPPLSFNRHFFAVSCIVFKLLLPSYRSHQIS